MDVFTHFSIIRRERRGIRPEEIKADGTRFLDLGKFPENWIFCQGEFVKMMTIWAIIDDIIKAADQNSP